MTDERDIIDQQIWAVCGAAIDYAPSPSREQVIAMNKRLTALCMDLVRTAKAQEREAIARHVEGAREREGELFNQAVNSVDPIACDAHCRAELVTRVLADDIRKRGA